MTARQRQLQLSARLAGSVTREGARAKTQAARELLAEAQSKAGREMQPKAPSLCTLQPQAVATPSINPINTTPAVSELSDHLIDQSTNQSKAASKVQKCIKQPASQLGSRRLANQPTPSVASEASQLTSGIAPGVAPGISSGGPGVSSRAYRPSFTSRLAQSGKLLTPGRLTRMQHAAHTAPERIGRDINRPEPTWPPSQLVAGHLTRKRVSAPVEKDKRRSGQLASRLRATPRPPFTPHMV
eukprot:CAMPEP_0174700652 /NCGR_PEP_ID=MMETSP1094-20130205/5543_1 /TAXON_ID=156173 /ORGANISM="Chrysochromulina brevifilum, Strain UTEX LB 985" /LENGTH=241 /DNA_ID=CAMNT_0015898171 /DNA_START=380 /DNA_END=1105 /DNA_ORIENTATION=+